MGCLYLRLQQGVLKFEPKFCFIQSFNLLFVLQSKLKLLFDSFYHFKRLSFLLLGFLL